MTYAFIIGISVAAISTYLFHLAKELPQPASRPAEDIPQHKYNQYLKQSKLTGIFHPNSTLHNATVLFKGQIQGSESIVVAPYDSSPPNLFLLDQYGNIYQTIDNIKINHVAYIGPGRPLGAGFNSDGNLIICDALKGLIQLDLQTKKVTILCNEAVDNKNVLRKIGYANDLDISLDGTVYFTSSSDIPAALNTKQGGFYDTTWNFLLALFYGKPTGFLVQYDPKSNRGRVLLDELWWANGVALSQNEDFVAVAETVTGTIYKYWLKGPKKGQSQVLIEALPGYPDGLTRDPDGTFWIAMIAKPLDVSLPFNRWIRTLGANILAMLHPPIAKFGLIINVDENGKILHAVMDEDGSHVHTVSGVAVADGKVFMGCLDGDFVSYIEKSQLD